jgi:hypothetical protein
LYSLPSIIRIIKSRRMSWARHTYRLLVGKPERKRPPGRPKYGWVDSSKIGLGGVGLGWSGLD